MITKRAKLDLQLEYMVIRTEDVVKIHLSEIGTVMIESTAVSITASLLSALMKRKIKVIFCDEKRLPEGEMVPYYGSHDASQKYKKQIEWQYETKRRIWAEIVAEKIRKQAEFLKELGRKEYVLLNQYIAAIKPGDESNREGHAAKVYFNSLFGMNFSRTLECDINAALNYGYSIILSAFSREIVAQGYFTQLGIFHDNMFNAFNLACDLMEPYRIIVDRQVYHMNLSKFEREEKMQLVDVLNHTVSLDGNMEYLNRAIRIYSKSVLDALNENNPDLIKKYQYEL